jgi:integrase
LLVSSLLKKVRYQQMPLTDTAVRKAKPSARPAKLSDGGGLHLLLTPSGGRLWRLQYRFGGKQKMLAFGAYPGVSLSEARVKRDAAKQTLKSGIDPGTKARLEKLAKQVSQACTFSTVADEYLAKLVSQNRASTTMKKVVWLLDFARPLIGDRPIEEIKPAEVLAVLRQVERRGRLETARRLRSTIGSVFRYAIATARADADPTTALTGALATPTVTPRAAILNPQKFGGLLKAIDGFDGQPTTKAALALMALLFPRPGELRAARWLEFDLDAAVWNMPAERTKMRRAHRVPLAPQALTILRELRKLNEICELVFPSVRTVRRPISENTLGAALRRLGYAKDEMSAHGFRAAASTMLNESGRWHADAIERQLGHVEGNDIRRAYARGEHWDERIQMMSWWANYIDSLRGDRGIIVFRSREVSGERVT